MADIKCDQCGNLNPEHMTRCALCDDPLREEKAARAERRRRMSIAVLIPATLLVTAAFVYLPGWLVVHIAFHDVDPGLVWAIYLALWGVGLAIGHYYRPKDDYDLGWNMGRMGYMDNPFSFRDNVDRGHLFVGFALAPVHIVRALWVECYKALTGGRGSDERRGETRGRRRS